MYSQKELILKYYTIVALQWLSSGNAKLCRHAGNAGITGDLVIWLG